MSRYTDEAELDNWFAYHPASSPAIMDGHEFVRRECRELASMLNKILPECAEKTLALRKIREGAMWGNAAIACRQEVGDHPWVARLASINVTQVTEPECVHVNVYADPEAQAQMAEWLGQAIEEAATEVFGPLDETQRKRFEDAVNATIAKAAQLKREEPDEVD